VNIIIFSAADRITNNSIRLPVKISDRRAEQIIKTHGSKIGDTVKIGELNGLIGHGIITALDKIQVTIRIEQLDTPPPEKLPLTILLALPRPKVIRRVLRSLTELGVARIVLIHAYKVEKSYWQSPLFTEDKLRNYLLTGLMQCRDTVLPELIIRQRFKPFVEDELAELACNSEKIVAHPGNYPPCPTAINQACTLAIGPEGGFIPYEIEKLQEVGFQCVSLGERILRVETAVCSLIGRLYT
jgi:16S rRNA (uracil1498-N3)-methyltransferase